MTLRYEGTITRVAYFCSPLFYDVYLLIILPNSGELQSLVAHVNAFIMKLLFLCNHTRDILAVEYGWKKTVYDKAQHK